MSRPRKVKTEKKRRRVTVQFIAPAHAGKRVECYAICDKLIANERADLKPLKIGFAWRLGWRADPDGFLPLGKCRKRGDLDRELDEYDFIILLNKEAWPVLEAKQKERLIFHELEHAQLSLDSNGDPKKDDRGRFVCRVRKHDIEEFRSVIEKYGMNEDLSKLALAAIHDAERPLLAAANNKGMEKTVAAEETKHKAKQPKKGQRRVKDL